MKKVDITKLPPGGRKIAICGAGVHDIALAHADIAASGVSDVKTVIVASYKKPNQQFTVDMDKLKTLSREEFEKEVLTIGKGLGLSANRVVDIFKELQRQTERSTKCFNEMAEELGKICNATVLKESEKTPPSFNEEKKQQRILRNKFNRKSKW